MERTQECARIPQQIRPTRHTNLNIHPAASPPMSSPSTPLRQRPPEISQAFYTPGEQATA
ncbi:MAG: hypothetical protein LC114_11995 [Bryobacterales bacterium]|nr:hypothetical protein [Bryobacterales bacterium]